MSKEDDLRIDRIYELMALKVPADDIDKIVKSEVFKHRRENGHIFEEEIANVIRSISFVDTVTIAQGNDDRRGDDMFVTFCSYSRHESLSIQVKSSTSARKEAELREKVEAIDSRRMFLSFHPDTSHATIKKTFLAQLEKMDGYILPDKY